MTGHHAHCPIGRTSLEFLTVDCLCKNMSTAHCVVTIPYTIVEKLPVAPKEVVVKLFMSF